MTVSTQALAQTVPVRVTTLSGDVSPGLVGNATQVRFKTLYAPHGQLGGLYWIDVHLEPTVGSRTTYDLIATQTLVRPDVEGAPVEVGLRSTLATHVIAVSLRYFGTEDGDVALFQWQPEWSSDRLPRLVRFDVTFAPGQPQIWQRIDLPLQLMR